MSSEDVIRSIRFKAGLLEQLEAVIRGEKYLTVNRAVNEAVEEYVARRDTSKSTPPRKRDEPKPEK